MFFFLIFFRPPNHSRKLWVGKLEDGTTEENIRDAFSVYGPLEEVIFRDDYAFVIFEEEDHATAAMTALHER